MVNKSTKTSTESNTKLYTGATCFWPCKHPESRIHKDDDCAWFHLVCRCLLKNQRGNFVRKPFKSPHNGSQLHSNHSGSLNTNPWCSVAKYIKIVHLGAVRAQKYLEMKVVSIWSQSRESGPRPAPLQSPCQPPCPAGQSVLGCPPSSPHQRPQVGAPFSTAHGHSLKGPAHVMLLFLTCSTNWKLPLLEISWYWICTFLMSQTRSCKLWKFTRFYI